MPRILFLCTGNSARSQMAEGLARSLGGPGLEVWSAGTEPKAVHPLAVRTMSERGIDISGQQSKGLDDVPREADLVITLCDSAAAACPAFPGKTERMHWSLPDPAAAGGSEDERLEVFRNVAGEIERRLSALFRARGLLRVTPRAGGPDPSPRPGRG